MTKEKLGQEPAFAVSDSLVQKEMEGYAVDDRMKGMSKRFYAACAAMSLPEGIIEPKIENEDVVEDKKGNWIKDDFNETYKVIQFTWEEQAKKYSTITTFKYRFVRELYKIADELLKQE